MTTHIGHAARGTQLAATASKSAATAARANSFFSGPVSVWTWSSPSMTSRSRPIRRVPNSIQVIPSDAVSRASAIKDLTLASSPATAVGWLCSMPAA